MASLSILVSAGTLLAAIGFGVPAITAGALFYLVSSTLALGALFLLAELIERSRSANEVALEDDGDLLPRPVESLHPPKGINLDDEQKAVVGQVIPWTMAFLGLSFIACALLTVGMPPLSGFIAKLNLIGALVRTSGPAAWALVALLILSGLAALLAMTRLGIQRFWTPQERPSPLLRPAECVPIVVLLGLCVVLTAKGQWLLDYTHDTAAVLDDPSHYIDAVMTTEVRP